MYAAGDDSDTSPDPMTDPLAASHEFVEMLVDQYLQSAISARTLCMLCFWAQRASMPGRVSEYAMRPGAPTGHYQRHLDHAMGFLAGQQKNYTITVPAYPKGEVVRANLELPLRCVRENMKHIT